MQRVKQVLDASVLWRALMALCAWVGVQWERSGIIQWFLHPRGWSPRASENSIFFKIWSLIRGALCRLYELLHLDVLFQGSVFTKTWLWCALPVVLAPAMAVSSPSIAVLLLCAAYNGIRNRPQMFYEKWLGLTQASTVTSTQKKAEKPKQAPISGRHRIGMISTLRKRAEWRQSVPHPIWGQCLCQVGNTM